MTDRRWDDDRLRAAFLDRFGGAAPEGLADLAIARAGTAPVRRRSAVPAWAGAVAAVLVVAMGGGVLLWARASAPGPSPSSPDATASPGTNGIVPFPVEVLGLPVISVSEAIARRDAGPDDSEIAVRGWEPPMPPAACPAPQPPPSPIERWCEFGWLTEQPETLWVVDQGGSQTRSPVGPGLQPLYGIETPRAYPSPQGNSRDPVPVVLVGHFDDYRSGLCPNPDVCRREFIVDSRVWADGQVAGHEIRDNREPRVDARLQRRDVLAAVEAVATPLERPWVALLTPNFAADVDPRIADTPGLGEAPLIWVVRQIERVGGRVIANSYLVNDSTARPYKATATGIATAVVPRPPVVNPTEPATVYGLEVTRPDALPEAGDLTDEPAMAIRGWYVVPPLTLACPPPRDDVEPIPASEWNCPDNLAWLLADSAAPWADRNGRLVWRQPSGAYVPLEIPSGIPFDLARDVGFRDPVDVIVVGRFVPRCCSSVLRTFLVTALVSRNGVPTGSQTPVTGPAPRDRREDVEARVTEAMGRAIATWARVVPGSEVPDDPSPGRELLTADSVWIVDRLVQEEGRVVIRTALTADGSDRVWSEDSLAPTHRLAFSGAAHLTLDVLDWPDIIVGLREAVPDDAPSRDEAVVTLVPALGPVSLSNPGGRLTELRVAWTPRTCDTHWTLTTWPDSSTLVLAPRTYDTCPTAGDERAIVLTFSRPMPAEQTGIAEGFGTGG